MILPALGYCCFYATYSPVLPFPAIFGSFSGIFCEMVFPVFATGITEYFDFYSSGKYTGFCLVFLHKPHNRAISGAFDTVIKAGMAEFRTKKSLSPMKGRGRLLE